MLKQTLLLLTTSTLLLAQSTMCYKENHTSPSTIESIKLDGGECKSSKSVTEMKNDGWTISNISMNAGTSGMNYMYVFSKGSNISNLSMQALSKEDLKSTMRQLAKEEEVALEKARAKEAKEMGKNIYKQTCSKCHGNDAQTKAYGKSKALTTFTSAKEFVSAMDEYTHNDRVGLTASIMQPYANSTSAEEEIAIFKYIQTLK